jgi:hypothetical protein
MNLSELREKTLAFLVPIVIVVVVLWGSIALIGKAYFWDVSTLSLEFAEGSQQMVRIEVQARIIYFDADLLGFYYPVHITLPRTYEQDCSEKCSFSRLPPGDAVITVFSDKTPLRTRVLILPDTLGNLDFRPPFEITSVNTPEMEKSFITLTDDERRLLTGTVEYSSRTQGLALLHYNRNNTIYDIRAKQTHLLPFESRPTQIARAEEEGSYLVWVDNAVMLWDRYGRTPAEKLTELTYQGYSFVWRGEETTITRENGKQVIQGYWSPLFRGEKMYITDGKEVREVK